VIVPLLPLGA
jgi:hypothetical protein